MKFLSFLSLVCLLSFSQVLFSAGPVEHKYTPKDQIEFAPSTKAAFDHSGDRITHSTLADGSQVAEHNGTLGNVSVARMGPDGTIETFCTGDEEAARAWMAGKDIGENKAMSTATIVAK